MRRLFASLALICSLVSTAYAGGLVAGHGQVADSQEDIGSIAIGGILFTGTSQFDLQVVIVDNFVLDAVNCNLRNPADLHVGPSTAVPGGTKRVITFVPSPGECFDQLLGTEIDESRGRISFWEYQSDIGPRTIWIGKDIKCFVDGFHDFEGSQNAVLTNF